ncbi:RecA [Lysinibacillus phage vB_LfM_LysYB1]|nr:RecA [Lysinibacillus phage vB_LfM_LysYB1]
MAPERKPIKADTKTKPATKKSPTPPTDEQLDDFEAALVLDMNKTFAESSMLLDDTDKGQVTFWLPSGNPWLDKELGGGYPGGRIIEIYGPESNGKTTVALHAIAETQKLGGTAIFLDTEHALDKRRAEAIGVNLKKLIYAQPETMETLFEYIEEIVLKIKEKAPDRVVTIVWDSVAATPTKSEIEGDYGDAVMGIHARIMSQAFRKITKIISSHKVVFICINQVRDKMNVSYGEKTSTFGGRALKFYATQRLQVTRVGNYKEGDVIKGIQCEATVKKNKVAPPFGVAKFNILFRNENAGMDAYGSLLDGGFEAGIFGTSKGWFDIDGKKYRRAEATEYLMANPDKFQLYFDTMVSAQ